MLLQFYFPLLLVVGLVDKATSSGGRTTAATTRKPTTLGWNPRVAYKEEKHYSNEDSYEKKNNYGNDRSDNYRRYDDDDGDDDYDRKPSRPRKVYKKKPDSVGSMSIYIREKGKKKGSYKKVRFPAARYNHKKHRNFGSLVSLAPWLPILVDRLTKQTFFITPVGGIIVVPPIVNFIGKVIPIAHLILSGYASLVSTGAPLAPGVDVGPLVSNTPVAGPNVPKVDPNTGDFKGAVRVDYEPPRPADLPPVYGDRINPRPAPQLVYSEPDYQQPPPPPPPQYQPPPPPPQYQPPPPQYQPPPPQYQQPPPQFPPPQPPPPPRQFQPDRPVYGGAQDQPADQFPQPNYPDQINGNGEFGPRRSPFNNPAEPAYPPVISE